MAKPWLTVYRNETRLVGVPDKPVILTEAGWSRDFCTELERASWQVSAWKLWLADPQVTETELKLNPTQRSAYDGTSDI